jgi:DNA-binding NtrC family response regulator
MSKAGVYTCPLPGRGRVTLGRGEECDIRLDDEKMSRVHAVLTLDGRFWLTDGGSTNGTAVAGRLLEPNLPVEIAIGQMITLGSTAVLLQSALSLPVRVLSQDAFADAVTAALRESAPLAIVRLRLDKARAAAVRATATRRGGTGGAAVDPLERVLRDALRPTDVLGTFGASDFVVLLPATDAVLAERLAGQLGALLKEEGVAGKVGHACHPRDGSTLADLVARAEKTLRDSDDKPAPPLGADVPTGAMARLEPLVARVAASVINVLILGETGVGKDVLARRLHERSPRASGPFVTLNCAAISESLLESELFGHERGAFTGAQQAKPGLLEAAHGGTFFLDEIGEMPPALQAKLLRVLEQREVLRVGSLKPRAIDVRFLAATNRDLERDVEQGAFRRDLYFRLNGVAIVLPPLRERTEEIEALANVFIAGARAGLPEESRPRLSAKARELMLRYTWPGNIRELRNMMERAILFCDGPEIEIEHLPVESMRGPEVPLGAPPPGGAARAESAPRQAAAPEDDGERRRIVEALEKCAGNQTKAAELLGISRRTLVSRLKELSVPRPRK